LSAQTAYVRFYLLPAEHSYLMFTAVLRTGLLHWFPAKPLLLMHTFFADGHRLAVTNVQLPFRPSANNSVTTLCCADVNATKDVLDFCRTAVREHLDAGRKLAPILSPDEFVAKVAELSQQNSELARRRGYYSWRDAVAQSFTAPAKEEL
jgi:hypothetical protein